MNLIDYFLNILILDYRYIPITKQLFKRIVVNSNIIIYYNMLCIYI